VPGAVAGPAATLIRHNVFIKTDRPSDDGDRPNLLVGGFPDSGEGAEDSYQIYGNLFVHNPREALLQVSGRVSIHDNIFIDTPVSAIRLQDHDLPLQRAWVYHNTIFVEGSGVSFGSSARAGSSVIGNAIFAGTPIGGAAGDARDNVVGTPAEAMAQVAAASTVLGAADFYPVAGALSGGALDLSAFAGDVDYDLDFNCQPKGAATHRGAYAGAGSNPGWQLAADNKPLSACASSVPGADAGSPGSDAGSATRDAGPSAADAGPAPAAGGRNAAGAGSADRDARVTTGGDAGASQADAGASGGGSAGCGCRLSARPASRAAVAWTLLLIAAALVGRIRLRATASRAAAGSAPSDPVRSRPCHRLRRTRPRRP
jgi:hypothetical protein